MSAETTIGGVADEPLNDVAHMRDAVLFEGHARSQKLSRFWLLLVLASIIAAAGVVADSTATVIGAMIVAPMLLPIQGTMLSAVVGDRINLRRSLTLVIAGAVAAVAIAYVVGLLDPNPVSAATNSEVAGRVSPGLIDLLAALGTGVVGSIALVRKDISDTLPGVAIAISLVPPLSVVGLTLESGLVGQALGALLLFVTNVAAILATGVVVMAIYRVRGRQQSSALAAPPVLSTGTRLGQRGAIVVIVGLLIVVGIPLTYSTVTFTSDTSSETTVRAVAERWAQHGNWEILAVTTDNGQVTIRATGNMPEPRTAALKSELRRAGVDPSRVRLDLVPSYESTL